VEAFAAIAREIAAQSGVRCAPAPQHSVGGGSVNVCWRWPAADGALFVKVGTAGVLAAFEAEAAGLAELAAARALRVPRTVAVGQAEEASFLALEWLEAQAPDGACEGRLGTGLAALHAVTAAHFGWRRENTIGRTPQHNGWSADWAEFFGERRLRPQLALAITNGFGQLLDERGARLLELLPLLLAAHAPAPSLLHGDLWGGNWLALPGGEPVIFDPAVYFGDRETDIAMTRLFGGFGGSFYRAYEAAAPPAPGAAQRAELYNLYHVLNHANLFGGGYARQARAIIDRLLAQLGH
jgi:protein-ribulosamine 3-kinase